MPLRVLGRQRLARGLGVPRSPIPTLTHCSGFWVGDGAILTRKMRLLVYRDNVLGWAITAIVRLIRDGILLQVAPTPSTGNVWSPAGTVERPFVRESFSERQQVRPVTVGAEARQISSQAFWTLNAMANARSHVGVR